MQRPLPVGFEDLSEFVPTWAHASYSQRQNARLASDMKQIRAFYKAMMARLDAIVGHLNEFPIDALPPGEQTLLDLCLSLAQVGNCVTLWHAPDQQDAFDAQRMEALLDN
jgi:hypothetical protein